MKLSILGSGPLANATAHCCRQYHNVMRVPDPTSDLYWFCEDTPIDHEGVPDVEYALAHIFAIARTPPISGLMLVSTQLPVGSTKRLENEFPNLTWAYNPENVRHASALTDFERQDRAVVGCRQHHWDSRFRDLFEEWTDNLILTDPESAELIKSATNGYIGLTIAYANEIAAIAAKVGANPLTVAEALQLDSRLRPKSPGAPYSGGHIEREVHNLDMLRFTHGLHLPLIEAIDESNEVKR